MEIHLSIKAKHSEKPEERLQKAIAQLSNSVEKSGGKVIIDEQTGA
jgi:hypothetical protein